MLKLSALALLSVANAQTLTCLSGEDKDAPWVLVTKTETGCKYCTATINDGDFKWGCVTPDEYVADIPTTEFTTGKVCLTNEAVLRNYLSKSTAKAMNEAIEILVKIANTFGGNVSVSDFAKKTYAETVFHCNNANSCNNIIDVDTACKTLKLVAYDESKNTGFFDSNAAGLAVTAATLVLISYQ